MNIKVSLCLSLALLAVLPASTMQQPGRIRTALDGLSTYVSSLIVTPLDIIIYVDHSNILLPRYFVRIADESNPQTYVTYDITPEWTLENRQERHLGDPDPVLNREHVSGMSFYKTSFAETSWYRLLSPERRIVYERELFDHVCLAHARAVGEIFGLH